MPRAAACQQLGSSHAKGQAKENHQQRHFFPPFFSFSPSFNRSWLVPNQKVWFYFLVVCSNIQFRSMSRFRYASNRSKVCNDGKREKVIFSESAIISRMTKPIVNKKVSIFLKNRRHDFISITVVTTASFTHSPQCILFNFLLFCQVGRSLNVCQGIFFSELGNATDAATWWISLCKLTVYFTWQQQQQKWISVRSA